MTGMAPRIRERLRCPACGGGLADAAERLLCQNTACERAYPVVRGVPVLIDDDTSVMRTGDYLPGSDQVVTPARQPGPRSALRRLAARLYARLPSVTRNVDSRENYRRFAEALRGERDHPLVLIVGGREVGQGMDDLLAESDLEFIETDIDFGERTRIVCDGHQLPFADGSVDGVVVQAVLEHVLDPILCVAEIHRVLSPRGVVYAETPFLFRRHGGPYDFTRFTFLGHRRLFRRFEEIHSGVALGPGSAMAVVYTGFLLTLTRRRAVRALLRIFGILTSFWWKYLDPVLVRNDVSFDVAGGFAFIGRRSESILADRDLIRGYRGLR